MVKIINTTADVIGRVIDNKFSDLNSLGIPKEPNFYVVLKNGKSQSIIAKVTKSLDLVKVTNGKKAYGVKAKSVEQSIFLDALLDRDTKLIIAQGPAGCGKTYLSLAAAAETVLNSNSPQNYIMMSKSISEVGRYRLGTVPGTAREKFDPYLDSFKDILNRFLSDRYQNIDILENEGTIAFKPINFLRGVTVSSSFVIIDEGQNLTEHEILTIGTRIGEDSKLVILGDVNQSDEANRTDGMMKLFHSEAIRSSSITATVNLTGNFRSEVSSVISKAFLEKK